MARPPRFATLLLAGWTAASLAMPCTAQEAVDPEARKIIETALRTRAERLEGIHNYTLVQSIDGLETTLYFKKLEIEGLPVFRIVPPHEYQGEALEKAGLGAGGAPGRADGPSGELSGGPGKIGGHLPEILEGLAALQDLPLPGERAGSPPGAAGAERGRGNLPQKATGAVLGVATGGLQQRLMQKGMQQLMGLGLADADDDIRDAAFPVRGMEDFARTARLEGTEVVDGAECHMLRADAIQDSELARQLAGGAEVTLRSITMWIDTEEYVPRRAMSQGEITVEGRTRQVTLELRSGGYRRVDGMYEPFRVVMRASGMMDAMASADPKKAEKIRRDTRESMGKMEQLEEMLARMPPEQRRMAEAQMGPALERLKQFSEGGFGDTEIVTEVKELRVNEGPPTPFGRGEIVAGGDTSLELPHMIARIAPAADASGRPMGWTIQLMGMVEAYGGGVVHLQVPGDRSPFGERMGNARASFRWEDGKLARFTAPNGGARITIRSNDGKRIAGEFAFQAAGEIRTANGTRQGGTVVRGRFDSPVPPALPGFPLDAPSATGR